MVIVMMDEYLEPAPGGGFRHVSPRMYPTAAGGSRSRRSGHPSTRWPARAIPDGRGVAPGPRPTSAAYEPRIAAAGGVDLFIVASGASDGHVAFMPPGSSRGRRGRHRAPRGDHATRQHGHVPHVPVARRGAHPRRLRGAGHHPSPVTGRAARHARRGQADRGGTGPGRRRVRPGVARDDHPWLPGRSHLARCGRPSGRPRGGAPGRCPGHTATEEVT